MVISAKKIKILSRRSLVLKGPMAFVLYTYLQNKGRAQESQEAQAYQLHNGNSSYSDQFTEALKNILQGARSSSSDNLILDMPEYAENGSIVPFKITANYPMNNTEYVKAIHLLSTLNPNARVASFFLTPQSGKAEISGRMRLAKTQDVYTLAHLSNREFFISTQKVEVLIGGCGME